MSAAPEPKDAATVILLRRGANTGFEVFLTRRPAGMAFLGDMYCFPGGGVRREDRSRSMVERCRGLAPAAARRIAGHQLGTQDALAFWIAAIRELFEEIGILLAVDASGHSIRRDGEPQAWLKEKHLGLLDKSMSFQTFLETEELFCDARSLLYFSHWQTPARFPIRFDTRFFLAVLPQGQSPIATSREVTHSLWLAPDRALNLFEHQRLPIMPPTFASLRSLADFDGLEGLLKEFRHRA